MHIQVNDMPVLRPIPGTRKWIVEEDWYYTLPNTLRIIIPKGFITDLVSIPRIFWPLISPTGSLLIPALIHDFGYRFGYLWGIKEGKRFKYAHEKSKDFWDYLFLLVGKQANHKVLINEIAYFFVYNFGHKSWKDNRLKQEQDLI